MIHAFPCLDSRHATIPCPHSCLCSVWGCHDCLVTLCNSVSAHTGEQLTTAWVSVLELLSVVPQAEEADTVQLAFQSVQLLCSDYMSSLPVQHLRRCVEVAALYGSQQVCVCVTESAGGHHF